MKKALAVVILGPTASGKTSLAIEIANKINGEIISADSMQIYKKMDIATAKPTAYERSQAVHHLIDIIEPDEDFNVARYKEMAIEKMEDIISRNKIPVIAGGTGFYIDTLINNTEFLDYEKSDIRECLEAREEKEGIEALFEELKRVDPETAAKLHINDRKRIIRALELYTSTGRTMSEQRELSHKNKSGYNWCIIGLNALDRQILYDRINLRVDEMIKAGLVEETKKFYFADYSSTAVQAIGYKELKPWLDGAVSFEDAVEKLKMETRRYAKRQLTWFRKNKDINWLYIDQISKRELVDEAEKLIRNFQVIDND